MSLNRTLGICGLVAAAGCATACANTPVKSRHVDDTTRAYQADLVAGMPSVTERKVEIRDLPSSSVPDFGGLGAPTDTGYDYRGTSAEAASTAAQEEIQTKLLAAGWSAEPATGRRRVIFSDVAQRKEYMLDLSKDEIDAIREAGDLLGLSLASKFEPGGSEDPSVALPSSPMGLSDGIENRVNKGISTTYPITHANLRRLGSIHGIEWCSAVAVGRRLVLTAGHCVVAPDLSQPPVNYWARRSGETYPYGTETSIGFWWDSQFSGNNCQINYNNSACAAWDWALLLLPSNAWANSPNGSPGWMGYQEPSAAQLAVHQYFIDGYGACNQTYSPPGCVNGVPFGQTTGGYGANQYYPDPGDGNFYTLFLASPDTNTGYSGSPFYRYADNIVQGIHVAEGCGNCTAQDHTPNVERSITPWLHGFISWARSVFP